MPAKGQPGRNPNNVQRSFFKTIDSPIKAYWLGWLTADGCVCRCRGTWQIAIALQCRDKQVIEGFRDAISVGGTIRIDNKRHCASFNLFSREMGDDLIRHKVIPRKSCRMVWSPFVPDEFRRHYLLGYFDGNGSLQRTKQRSDRDWSLRWVLAGSKTFLESSRRFLKSSYDIDTNKPYADKNSSGLHYLVATGRHVVTDIDFALNHDDFSLLKRKHLPLPASADSMTTRTKKPAPPTPSSQSSDLTIMAAARELSVSRGTLLTLLRSGAIRHYTLPLPSRRKFVRITRAALEEYRRAAEADQRRPDPLSARQIADEVQ